MSIVADAIVQVVGTPFGKRHFRVHIDPSEDGANVSLIVIDRIRAELLHLVLQWLPGGKATYALVPPLC